VKFSQEGSLWTLEDTIVPKAISAKSVAPSLCPNLCDQYLYYSDVEQSHAIVNMRMSTRIQVTDWPLSQGERPLAVRTLGLHHSGSGRPF